MGCIWIEGRRYAVGNQQGALVEIQLCVNNWMLKKRKKNESDKAMEERVAMDVAEWRQVHSRAQIIAATKKKNPCAHRACSLSRSAGGGCARISHRRCLRLGSRAVDAHGLAERAAAEAAQGQAVAAVAAGNGERASAEAARDEG